MVITMKKPLKYSALIILPLFMVMLSIGYVGMADAIKNEDESGSLTGLGSYESRFIGISCEDRLCFEFASGLETNSFDEEEDETRTRDTEKKHASSTDSSDGPYAEVIGLFTKNKGAYEVIVRVYAVDEDLREGSLLLTSDTFRKTVVFPKIKADSFATIKTKMRADDPRTITAEVLKYEGTFERPICYQRDRCDF